MPLGDLISGAFSLFGGRKAQKSQDRVNQLNLAHSDKWNQRSLDFADRQFTSAIQTRVADARKAGIHPLAALGHPGAGSPSFSTGGAAASGALGSGIANAGQAIGRAMKRDPMAQELHDANVANLEAQTAKSNAEALYFASEARRGQNGVGLPFHGERGQRMADVAWEIASIRSALAARQGKANRRASASSAAPRRAGRSQRAHRDAPVVLNTPFGRMPISAATPSVDDAEKWIGDWADWQVGIPNWFNLYGAAAKRHMRHIFKRDPIEGRASKRQRYLRWMRRKRGPR